MFIQRENYQRLIDNIINKICEEYNNALKTSNKDFHDIIKLKFSLVCNETRLIFTDNTLSGKYNINSIINNFFDKNNMEVKTITGKPNLLNYNYIYLNILSDVFIVLFYNAEKLFRDLTIDEIKYIKTLLVHRFWYDIGSVLYFFLKSNISLRNLFINFYHMNKNTIPFENDFPSLLYEIKQNKKSNIYYIDDKIFYFKFIHAIKKTTNQPVEKNAFTVMGLFGIVNKKIKNKITGWLKNNKNISVILYIAKITKNFFYSAEAEEEYLNFFEKIEEQINNNSLNTCGTFGVSKRVKCIRQGIFLLELISSIIFPHEYHELLTTKMLDFKQKWSERNLNHDEKQIIAESLKMFNTKGGLSLLYFLQLPNMKNLIKMDINFPMGYIALKGRNWNEKKTYF